MGLWIWCKNRRFLEISSSMFYSSSNAMTFFMWKTNSTRRTVYWRLGLFPELWLFVCAHLHVALPSLLSECAGYCFGWFVLFSWRRWSTTCSWSIPKMVLRMYPSFHLLIAHCWKYIMSQFFEVAVKKLVSLWKLLSVELYSSPLISGARSKLFVIVVEESP